MIGGAIGEVGVPEGAGLDEDAGCAEAHGGEDVVAVGVADHDDSGGRQAEAAEGGAEERGGRFADDGGAAAGDVFEALDEGASVEGGAGAPSATSGCDGWRRGRRRS